MNIDQLIELYLLRFEQKYWDLHTAKQNILELIEQREAFIKAEMVIKESTLTTPNKEGEGMSDMICSKCGRYGIYWKNLHTLSPYTFCPFCKEINCQKTEDFSEDEQKDEQSEAL